MRSRNGIKSRDYYEILGVERGATFREISDAYWAKTRTDRDKLSYLNEAYEVLGNEDRRRDYDSRLDGQ
ncbi:MAG: hypothetical protein WBD55_01185 [Dehalococcoidia bacterium]